MSASGLGEIGTAADRIHLGPEPIDITALVAWATTPAAGAVATFLGVVRDHAEGREGVAAMTYEAYEEPARRRMDEVVAAARRLHPDLERVAVVHRLGRLELGEASVAIVVSSPHRAAAFEAARFCIDTLKESVPIWKQEHWAHGSGWALGSQPIRPVPPAGPAPQHQPSSGA